MEAGTVAVLGTGIMGQPIARNLAKAGLSLRVWNRTRPKAEPLAEVGAVVCESPQEAASGAGVLVTMLADGPAVEAAVFGPDGALAGGSGDGLLWLQTSTVGPVAAERLGELAAARAVGYLDAPVLGTRKPAEDAALVVLCSGPEGLRHRAEPVFGAVARRVLWVGPVAGAASRLKLVVNHWVLSVVTAVSESVALAEGSGLDPELFFEALEGTQLDLPYARLKGEAMIEGRFTPSFPVAGAHKDAALILDAMGAADVAAEVAAANAAKLAAVEDDGHGDEDLAAVVLHSTGGRHATRPAS